MTQLQDEHGVDNLIVLYYHVNDPYATAETHNRASYYQVGGIPEVDFDGTVEVIGAGTDIYDVYEPIVSARLAETTPVTVSTQGVILPAADPDSSWVTATFKAVDTVPYGDLRANYIVYENTSAIYPWTVRDMLGSSAVTTLAAEGDSVVITKRFKVSAAWDFDNLHLAVFLEDTDPKLIINGQIMPDPFGIEISHTDKYAMEIPTLGMAAYQTVVENTGVMTDTITIEAALETIPDGLGPFDWQTYFRDSTGTAIFGPWDYVIAPGDRETLDVYLNDTVGTVTDIAITNLTAVSKGDPSVGAVETFNTFVGVPSILVVDDDGGGAYESELLTALADTGYVAAVWDADAGGRPSLTRLNSYWAVLWTTANGSAEYIGGEDENDMAAYLDGGGNLMLASMEFLSSRVNTLAFRTDYLHIDSVTNDSGGFIVSGEPGIEVSDAMTLNLLMGDFEPNPSDVFVANSPAQAIFTSPAGCEGIRVASEDYKLVFMSFPFELIKTDDADPNNQKSLVARVLNWFDESTGAGDTELVRLGLAQNYPNPFNPVTKLAFTVPEGAGRVTLTVHNVSGQVVRTLVDGELPAGSAFAVWDGKDEAGHELATGVYFARITAGDDAAFRKMTLLK